MEYRPNNFFIEIKYDIKAKKTDNLENKFYFENSEFLEKYLKYLDNNNFLNTESLIKAELDGKTFTFNNCNIITINSLNDIYEKMKDSIFYKEDIIFEVKKIYLFLVA